MTSQYFYKDEQRNEKSRVIRNKDNWFTVECKSITDESSQWIPFLFGTAEFLGLTDTDKEWAKDKR
tara:strand:- start:1148 stop:1345 length:198 start_codon:yes stop_codon:yes gene_type:complete